MDDRDGNPDLSSRRVGGPRLSRRRAPERLPGLVDSHAHLQHARFDADRDDVIARAVDAGIERICVPGWDVLSSEAALDLARRYPGVIDAGVGVHPHHAAEMNERAWARLESLVSDSRTRAVGEIGLDFYRLSPPEVQGEALARQLALAGARDLPVLVHDRDAHEAAEEALLAWGGRGVLHAFSGDAEMARRLVDSGFLVSFALPLAFGSATGPRAAAAALPNGAFLVETDSPYLGPDAARRNEPTTALRVVAELGRLRGVDPEALVAPIRAAYDELIGPAGP
jgi:TatD DNase family protein